MNRRTFLKTIGVAGGSVALPLVPKAKASLDIQVSELVLDPKDIIKDPNIGPVFDMNDDVTGLAGHFTAELCVEYIKTASKDDTLALIQWGLRQPAVIGLFLAKAGTMRVFAELSTKDREAAARSPEVKQMYTRYGELFDKSTVLGQWHALKMRR